MATDLEKLVVQLSADIKGYENAMRKAVGVTNRQTREIESRFKQMQTRIDGVGKGIARGIVTPMAGIGAALGTAELIKMTGVWTDLSSRINRASGGMDKGAEVMGRIGEMARRTYSDLEGTANAFLGFSTTLTDLGVATDRQLDFVESLNNALVVSGAKGQVAERVMDALAKAMATGSLQGDNLNTVIEVGGRVAEALAASMGVTTLELRKLGTDGKIGRREMLGLTSQMEKLRAEAAEMPATIQDGFTLLNNALLEYVGRGDEATGVSARVAEALTLIADNFDTVADAGLKVAGIIAGALVGRSLMGLIRTTAQGVSGLMTLTTALSRVSSVGALASAFGGLGLAAGPAAMVVGGALVASMIAFSREETDASRAAAAFAANMAKLKAEAEGVPEALDKGAKAAADAMRKDAQQRADALTMEAEQGAEVLRRMKLEAEETWRALERMATPTGFGASLVPESLLSDLQKLRDRADRGEIAATDLNAALAELSRANPNVSSIIARLGEVMIAALNAARRIREAASEAASVGAGTYISSGRGDAIGQYWADRRKTEAFIAEQTRINGLSKERQDIERRTAAILKEAGAAGAQLTQAQAEQLAAEQAAAEARRSKTGKGGGKGKTDKSAYADEVTQIREAIAALELEAKALNGAQLSLSGYGDVAEYARKRMELLVAAKKQGLEITPKLSADIDKLAQDYVAAGIAVDGARERHEAFQSALSETRSSMESAFTGLITGANGFRDALGQVLSRLAEMAASRAFATLWDGAGGAGSGGGIGKGVGGFVKKLLGFEQGGPTPSGPRKQAVGIVHAGENVWSQDDIRRAGGMAVVEAMRRNGGVPPGYMSGGPVLSPRIPSVPALGRPQVSAPVSFAIDARGAEVGVEARIKAALREAAPMIEKAASGRAHAATMSRLNASKKGW